MVIKEHPYIIWLDASTRFIGQGMPYLMGKTKVDRVVVSSTHQMLTKNTLKDTFDVLKEEPCVFRYAKMFNGYFIGIYAGAYEIQYLLKPFVSCALFPRCMVPSSNVSTYLKCEQQNYFKCHRFDQSVMSILMYRLYHIHISSHVINGDLFFKRDEVV